MCLPHTAAETARDLRNASKETKPATSHKMSHRHAASPTSQAHGDALKSHLRVGETVQLLKCLLIKGEGMSLGAQNRSWVWWHTSRCWVGLGDGSWGMEEVDKIISGAHWLASLAGSMLSKRPCLKNEQISKVRSGQGRHPTLTFGIHTHIQACVCTCTNMNIYIYIHHMHTHRSQVT